MRLSFILIIASVCFSACEKTVSPFEYRSVTNDDIEGVLAIWADRDLTPKNVEVIHDERGEDYRFLLVKHDVLGRVHYGGILLPEGDLTDAPVLVQPDGLTQENPSINMDYRVASGFRKHPPYSSFIKIFPGFRGRSVFHGEAGEFSSEGDFCDAYDGATDDSIALLNVAEKLFPEANFEKVLAYGWSRGGNIALLMGVRDPRVNTAIAQKGPVDFYREELKEYYGDQYECQFLTGKTDSQSRERMLASSPVYFRPHKNLQNVFLHYGDVDEIVPIWNAHKMTEQLKIFGVSVKTYIYAGVDHGGLGSNESSDVRAGIAKFLENINRQ